MRQFSYKNCTIEDKLTPLNTKTNIFKSICFEKKPSINHHYLNLLSGIFSCWKVPSIEIETHLYNHPASVCVREITTYRLDVKARSHLCVNVTSSLQPAARAKCLRKKNGRSRAHVIRNVRAIRMAQRNADEIADTIRAIPWRQKKVFVWSILSHEWRGP